MGNKKHKQKRVEYKGNIYVGTLSGGKVAVRIQRTACGQNMLAGIFDVQERSWQNEKRGIPLPYFVKHEIESAFAYSVSP